MPRTRKTTSKRPNKKNLKKTTKRGAYKPRAKRNFQIRRNPFVECKKQDDVMVALKAKVATAQTVDTIRRTTEALEISNGSVDIEGNVNPNTLTVFPLNSFYNMNQGLENSDIVGRSIFSKYLNCKLQIFIPHGQRCIKHPCELYLIHGFVTNPIANTLHTATTVLDTSRTFVQQHIQEQLQEYFNQRLDFLVARTKVRSNIKILGYRKVRPNRNTTLGGPPELLQYPNNQGGVVQDSVGALAPVNMVCKWPMMSKIQYSLGKDEAPQGNELQHMFPNYTRKLPFVCLYNPTAKMFLTGGGYVSQYEPKFSVRYNSTHYFSDS